MIKLYRATTMVDNYHGRDQVCFNWFCSKREQPVAPYEELIQDYQPGHLYAEDYVKELLTEAEVEELRAYLAREYGSELDSVKEAELPAPLNFMGYGALPAGGGQDFYMLDRTPGYDLSIPIWAYYDLRDCPDTVHFQPQQREAGAKFVELLLAKLEMAKREPQDYETLAESIYEESGLYVIQGKTPAELLADRDKPLTEDDLPF